MVYKKINSKCPYCNNNLYIDDCCRTDKRFIDICIKSIICFNHCDLRHNDKKDAYTKHLLDTLQQNINKI